MDNVDDASKDAIKTILDNMAIGMNKEAMDQKSEAVMRNAADAIQDPHVSRLIDLTLRMQDMTDDEIRETGRAIRNEQKSEREGALS